MLAPGGSSRRQCGRVTTSPDAAYKGRSESQFSSSVGLAFWPSPLCSSGSTGPPERVSAERARRGRIGSVKKAAATVAALVLAALCAGCGTRLSSTRLQIRLHDDSGARTYELRCNPDGGTVPNPAGACSSLATQPGLLAGGIGFDHSCPGGDWIEVVGQRRERRVSVVFPQCAWVPAQGDGKQRWK